MYRLQYIKAAVVLSVITIAMVMTTTIYGVKTAYADNSLTDKEEFDITVKNIKHQDVIVAVTVDGLNKKTTIQGNPSYIDAPTTQIIKFRFDRHNGANTPTSLPIKLGDEYSACISFKDSESSCLRSTIDSLTTPQLKTLDVKFIP